MKTFIVHVSVDAESEERAKMIVRHCIEAGGEAGCIDCAHDEVAVVTDVVDEIEE